MGRKRTVFLGIFLAVTHLDSLGSQATHMNYVLGSLTASNSQHVGKLLIGDLADVLAILAYAMIMIFLYT